MELQCNVHEEMREVSKRVLELYWRKARGWAADEVVEITETAQLGRMMDLTDTLEIWREKAKGKMTDGERILAYVNLGMLLEGWMMLFLCVWLMDYKRQASGKRLPYNLKLSELRHFFEDNVWTTLAEGTKWSRWIDKIRIYRNTVHSFMSQALGTTEELRDDLDQFDRLIVEEFDVQLFMDYDESSMEDKKTEV